ncbi:T27c4.14 protein isoform 3 [Hibiscus syriacus]|uniref:Exportin-4 n=1 Tax=Hibiscus syriacus TaxID=106335 RepID=A0A6A3B798_HIBSY|nr:T27c4.14 protein isoform 3 [Hibiscus syriacus]
MQGFSDGGADLGQLQTTMHHIEVACASIQMHINPAAAEATILALSQSPQPYTACRFILENSQVPNARFQAAAAIRDAAIREWSSLSTEERRSLISFCLCFVMQHASLLEGYVLAKVSSVAAQLMKRGWLDFTETEKEAFFYQVNQAILGAHGVDVQFIGVNFLESLVSEFSPSTSSAMGLPREFHEQCRTSLELNYLKMFYCWARDAALSVTNKIIEPNSVIPEVKVCTAALRLMLQILNWEFRNDTTSMKAGIDVFSAGVRHDSASSKRSECVLVQPGPAWFDVLISSGHVSWLLSLYAALRRKFSREGYWIDCPIAVSARKLIVQLCSLTGTIFPSDSVEDFLSWSASGDGLFSVKSCRKALGKEAGGSDLWSKGVWLGLSPPRVEAFIWQLAHQKIAVKVELAKRGMSLEEDILCPFCKEHEESVQHLFITCFVVWELWNKVVSLWDLSIVLPQDPPSLLNSWGSLRVNSLIWKFIPGVVFWSIWKARNAIVFEGLNLDRLSLFFIVRFRLFKWFLAKYPKFPILEDLLIGDPSLADAVRLNDSVGGIGGILRDWNNCTLLTFSENIGQGPPPVAELKAIKRGIEIFLASRWSAVSRLVVESDCKSAVEWIHYPSLAPVFILPLVKEILLILSEKVVLIRLIPRACNGEADSLAKKEIG